MRKIKYLFTIVFLLLINITIEAKIINNTSVTSINNDINLYYNELDDTTNKIYNTNKFNCAKTGCSSTIFNNIGLLSNYEYNSVGGNNSYLYIINPYYILDGSSISNLNGYDNTSGLRPTTYLVPDTKVTGSGTIVDPWIIKDDIKHEVNITSIGGSTSITNTIVNDGETLTINLTPDNGYSSNNITTTCKNGVINGTILTISNIKENLNCTVTFSKTIYSVSVASTTGSVSPSNISAEHGSSKTIRLTPNTGYTLTGAVTTCKNGTISGNILTISNITQNISCSVIFKKLTYAYTVSTIGGSVTPSSGTVSHGSSLTLTLTPNLGYELDGTTTTCNGSISGNKLIINNIASNINCVVSLGEDKTLAGKIFRDNYKIKERTDLSKVYYEYTTGALFKQSSTSTSQMTEDIDGDGIGEDVYYISGIHDKNWVKFGKEEVYECTYDGQEVWKLGVKTINGYYHFNSARRTTSSSECTSTYVCVLDEFGPVVGLTKSQCTADVNMGGTWTREKATPGTKVTKDIYWRIMRINEDKSVRLLFLGLDPETTNFGLIGTSIYNSKDNNPLYVGYMYGTTGSLANNRKNTNDSEIKKTIDTWYKNTLLTNYDKFVSKTAIYCNDRSTENNEYSTTSSFTFGVSSRTPTYKCGGDGNGGLFESTQAVEDKFSVSKSSGGNGKLTYPIGLMTYDEISYAGKDYDDWYMTNANGEQIIGKHFAWWTMSPEDSHKGNSEINVTMKKENNGYFGYSGVADLFGVRPVLSLKACVKYLSGDGTPSNPYQITIDSTCENKEN